MDKNFKHDMKVLYTFLGTLIVLSVIVVFELPWELSIIPTVIVILIGLANSPVYYWVCTKKNTEDESKVIHIEDYL